VSEREGYEQGVPSWVDHTSADPGTAVAFYAALFGWDAEDVMPEGSPVSYFMVRLRGRDVAAIAEQMPESQAPPAWTTYVAVDDADEIAGRVAAAGGSVLAEPMDVFDAGRLAVFVDSSGAAFAIWQAGQTKGAQLVNEPGAVTWNELSTRDPEGAVAFYGSVFGWQGVAMDVGVPYTVWYLAGADTSDMAGAVGGMMPMDEHQVPADTPPHWLVYFGVEDVPVAMGRVQELGGTVLMGPIESPGGTLAVFTDPVGAVFAVVERPAAG
jgi:uncharacterized protein